MNLGNPEQAMEASFMPADGVGLVRLEFIMSNTIKIHPNALLKFNTLDQPLQKEINSIIKGYQSPRHFFVDKLAQGVGIIAAAFYPRPVIVRFSDFKSNEYASLIGGHLFEPHEENPMLGVRGASRYFSEHFCESFALECEALKKVRNEMGLDNIQLLIPFVRSPKEANDVSQLLKKHGLSNEQGDLKIHLMCEIPSNALLADKFLEHFDGFSIGSNDLTQLTRGVDRDAGFCNDLEEYDEATEILMSMAIKACKNGNKYIGICGQAPSDNKELIKFLVKKNIDSISLNYDSLLEMKSYISEVEAT
jgi:pyruvate,water dikinase